MAEQASGNPDGVVKTVLGNHWCDILVLVPSEDRGRAVELMTLIAAEYGKELQRAESRGYRAGKEENTDAAQRQGYDEGWAACAQEIAGTKINADRAIEQAMTATVPSC